MNCDRLKMAVNAQEPESPPCTSQTSKSDTESSSSGEEQETCIEEAVVEVSRSNPSSWMTSPIVKINVVGRKQPYLVHKALLTIYVPYYRACLDSAFSESQTLEVHMDESDSLVVDGLVNWVYTDTLESVRDKMKSDSKYVTTLYQLADRLLIPDLKNTVVDVFQGQLVAGSDRSIIYCLASLSEMELLDSKFGEFLMDQLVWGTNCDSWSWVCMLKGQDDGFKEKMRRFFEDPELMAKFFTCTLSYGCKRWYDRRQAGDCSYHEHPDNKQCDGDGDGDSDSSQDASPPPAKKRKSGK